MNKFQKAAAEAYANGDHSHVENLTQADKVGDSLFLFVMQELEDVEDGEEAWRRIDRAIMDLQDVLAAVEDFL